MKKIFVCIVLSLIVMLCRAQQPATPAAQLAHKIANKMKDSLNLTSQQTSRIFQINMDLFHRKDEARKKSKDRDVIGKEIQSIETTRDSLYKLELTTEQYILYMEKKKVFVTNN